MDRYGRQLGIAFQIADDVLDLAGTERETGKTLGSDLAQRKLTLPLIRLLSSSSNGSVARARELISVRRRTRGIRTAVAAHQQRGAGLGTSDGAASLPKAPATVCVSCRNPTAASCCRKSPSSPFAASSDWSERRSRIDLHRTAFPERQLHRPLGSADGGRKLGRRLYADCRPRR